MLVFTNQVTFLRFYVSLYKISESCWCWHYIMFCVGSYNNCKQFLRCILFVSCVCKSENVPVASRIDMSKQVLVDWHHLLLIVVLETGYVESHHIEYSSLLVVQVVSSLQTCSLLYRVITLLEENLRASLALHLSGTI